MLIKDTLLSKSRRYNLDFSIDKMDLLPIVLGFFLARASILDKLTPFGIAFLAAYIIMKEANTYVLLSTIIGAFTFQGINGISYLFSSILIVAFFTINRENKKYSLIKSSIISSGIFVIIKTLMLSLNSTFFIYDFFIIMFEGIVMFTMTYIFSFSLPIESIGSKKVNSEKIICTFITLALVLAGFNSLSIVGISIKNIASTLFIIYFSHNQGALIGSSMGTIIGMVSYIAQPEMPFIIAIYGISGLLSGVFRDLGKIGTILGFVIGNGIISFYINGLGSSFLDYKELIISMALFLITSKYFNEEIEQIFTVNVDTKKDYAHKKDEIVIKKLSRISDLFNGLGNTFKESANETELYSSTEVHGLIDCVANGVCSGCPKYRGCWEENYYATYYSFFNLVGTMEISNNIDENIPDLIKNNCINQDLILDKMKRHFEIFALNHRWKTKLLENRLLLAEQLEGIGSMVDNITKDFYEEPTFNEELEEMIYRDLKNNRIDVASVSLAQFEKDNFEIFIDMNKSNNPREQINGDKIKTIISKTLDMPLTTEFTFSNVSQNSQRFKLIRSNRFSALTKLASAPNSEGYVSGDNYTFGEVENTYFSALSDGMGIGKKASIESGIAINLLEKLMEANMDKSLTIKTINSVLRAKSNEEIFTTLDLSFIDLYTGKLQMIKTGAPATFIKKKDRIEIVNSQCLPVGILKDVDFNIYEEYIEDGDIIIMMSDGILDASREIENVELWMKEVIMNISSMNPQVIANTILEKAREINNGSISDDMTVLVTKIWKNI